MNFKGDNNLNYQMSLFNIDLEKKEAEFSRIKIIAWNIQNSSKDRANKQFRWIHDMNPDIIVLTEVTFSAGFALIKAELEMQDYDVIYQKSDSYFTVIAIRNYKYYQEVLDISRLSERVNYIKLETPIGNIALIGVYAPTCSRDHEKILQKRKFHHELYNEVIDKIWRISSDTKIIVLGDFNILEPNHNPKYEGFSNYYKSYEQFIRKPFKDLYRYYKSETMEYSWFGQGMYQRLDHIFATENILPYVNKVEYLHEPRRNKFSDHSALQIELNI